MVKLYEDCRVNQRLNLAEQKRLNLAERYRIWKVYGSFTECITFGNDAVSDLDDDKLEQLVRNFVEIRKGSAITISRSAESTFVLFNFV